LATLADYAALQRRFNAALTAHLPKPPGNEQIIATTYHRFC
jgi:hypothetical protein